MESTFFCNENNLDWIIFMKVKLYLTLVSLFTMLSLCSCSRTDSEPVSQMAPTVTTPPPTVQNVSMEIELTANPHGTLSVPTQITKIGEDYFIVDCYHNQILTSDSLDKPLEEWYVLTNQINRGHTIAGNGTVYLADDTENNRVLVFEKQDTHFVQTQIFENIGNRPHYVEYDNNTDRFYVLSSMTGELYVFYQEESSSQVCLEKTLSIPDMQNVYIRSFTIYEDTIYFPASNGTILHTYLNDELTFIEKWSLPNELAGLVQVTQIEDYYYITVSTDLSGNAEYATILRTKDLSLPGNYEYEEIYDTFNSIGTPYYISFFDNHYYLTHHCYSPGHGVWQFDVIDNTLENVSPMYP